MRHESRRRRVRNAALHRPAEAEARHRSSCPEPELMRDSAADCADARPPTSRRRARAFGSSRCARATTRHSRAGQRENRQRRVESEGHDGLVASWNRAVRSRLAKPPAPLSPSGPRISVGVADQRRSCASASELCISVGAAQERRCRARDRRRASAPAPSTSFGVARQLRRGPGGGGILNTSPPGLVAHRG